MKEPFGGLILNIAFRMLVPFTITYGIYVLCLGEFSPGGGFQAGALLAVGVLLARLILGADTHQGHSRYQERNGQGTKYRTSELGSRTSGKRNTS